MGDFSEMDRMGWRKIEKELGEMNISPFNNTLNDNPQ